MNIFEGITRILATCAVIFFAVILWAVVPYLQSTEIDTSIMSIFLGNSKALSWTRDLLLLSRGAIGTAIALYIFMPVAVFFTDANLTHIRRDMCLLLVGISVCSWIGALIYHFLFVI